MASNDDVSARLKALTAAIEKQNSRLDALEKKIAKKGDGSGFSTLLTLAVVVALVAVAVQYPEAVVPLKMKVMEAYNHFTAIDSSQCQPLTLYRYGIYKNYSGPMFRDCSISQEELFVAANKMFPSPDNNISRVLSMTGRDMPPRISVSSEPLTVVMLSSPDREHFMWPVVKVGHTVTVELGEEKQKVVVKTLSPEPRVFELQNLLTEEECDTFYQVATDIQNDMTESMVGADHATSTKSLSRSSKHTWIGSVYRDGSGPWVTNEVIERVERRIFDLTRLSKETAEPFQVVFYNMSDYYYGHHDFTDPIHAPNNPYFQGGGNRYITVLLYLNDVEEGGHTAFPFADANGNPQLRHLDPTSMYQGSSACDTDGLKVHPKKGGAAMFYNLLENGHMDGKFDKWSVHAGCKPVKGPKYISNKWIRNKRVNDHLYDDVW